MQQSSPSSPTTFLLHFSCHLQRFKLGNGESISSHIFVFTPAESSEHGAWIYAVMHEHTHSNVGTHVRDCQVLIKAAGLSRYLIRNTSLSVRG